MVLYLGNGVAVREETVIALIDLQIPLPEDTALLLSTLQKEGRVRTLGKKHKTFVVCGSGYGTESDVSGILSCVGIRTLRQRFDSMADNYVKHDCCWN